MRASSSITQFQLGKAVRNTELENHPFVTLNNGPSWRPSVVLKPPQSADPPEQHGNAATAWYTSWPHRMGSAQPRLWGGCLVPKREFNLNLITSLALPVYGKCRRQRNMVDTTRTPSATPRLQETL